MVLARGRGSISGESGVEKFELTDSIHINQAPGRQTPTVTFISKLIDEQAYSSVLNTIIVRLGYSSLAVINESDVMASLDCCPDLLVCAFANPCRPVLSIDETLVSCHSAPMPQQLRVLDELPLS